MLPPVATFMRGSSSRPAFARNEATKREASGEAQTVAGKVTWIVRPVDPRGVPLIGRGCAGVIRGTQPGSGLS